MVDDDRRLRDLLARFLSENGYRITTAASAAEARAKSDPAERKKAYEKVAAKFLTEGSIMYLYHTQVLVALTDKVEGYKQMPDGLVRVVGVKLLK